MSVGELSLLKTMQEAYKTGHGCDVDVRVGGRKFKAGKWVLCANSPVFRAMFSGETKENQTNSIIIKEFDVDVVEQFLCYLHTGKLSDSCADQTKFFPIADYYDVKELREICLKAMFSSLDSTNAQECFKMAENFSLDDLKSRALDVMTKDLKDENFYGYLEFARSNQSEELEASVIKFIETSVWKLCKLPDWKKLDPELRLKLLESHAEKLDLKPISGEKLMLDVDCSRAATWNVGGLSKKIVLKNTGNTRLAYRISLVSDDQSVVANPRSGFITPGQKHYVKIQYTSQMVIVYQATTETDRNRCFQDDAFCRIIIAIGDIV